MFVAAVIALLVAVLLILAAVFGGGESVTLDLGSLNLNTTASGIFFLGMAALLLLGLSLYLFRRAARRARERRADRRRVSELSSKLDEYRQDKPSGAKPSQGKQPPS